MATTDNRLTALYDFASRRERATLAGVHVITDEEAAARAVAQGDRAFGAETHAFQAVVRAVAAAMVARRTEIKADFDRRISRDPAFVKYLGGKTPPATVGGWLERLNTLYHAWTETQIVTHRGSQGARSARQTTWKHEPPYTRYKEVRAAYFNMREKLRAWFGASWGVGGETIILDPYQGQYRERLNVAYGDLRLQGRNNGVVTADGRVLSVARSAPHWIVVYDAMDFRDPELLLLQLTQARNYEQAAAGAAYGAASDKAKAKAGAVAAAAQGLHKAFTRPTPAPFGPGGDKDAQGEQATVIPWGTILVAALVLGGIGLAIYAFKRPERPERQE